VDANEAGRGYQATMSKIVVRVLREYTGRGPTKARAIIGRDGVMVVMGDTMTTGERQLAEHGKAKKSCIRGTRYRRSCATRFAPKSSA
jgi:uncharacterized protein YbcI